MTTPMPDSFGRFRNLHLLNGYRLDKAIDHNQQIQIFYFEKSSNIQFRPSSLYFAIVRINPAFEYE